jgi:hypothetical protein
VTLPHSCVIQVFIAVAWWQRFGSPRLGSALLGTAPRKHCFVYYCVIAAACFDVTILTWRKYATICMSCVQYMIWISGVAIIASNCPYMFFISSVKYLTCLSYMLSRVGVWDYRWHMDWMIGFFGTWCTPLGIRGNNSAITDLHTLQFTITHTLGFSVFTSHILAMDFTTVIIPVSHMKFSFHSCTLAINFQLLSLLNYHWLLPPETPSILLSVKVKVIVTLWRAVYRQSVCLGVKPLETHNQRFFSPTESLQY